MRTESKEFPIITLKALQTEGKHPSLFHSNFLVGGEVERPLGLFLSFPHSPEGQQQSSAWRGNPRPTPSPLHSVLGGKLALIAAISIKGTADGRQPSLAGVN